MGRSSGPCQFQFETPTILLTVILALGLSLAVYRPFCQFICPFGFVSWLAERVSLVRVRVDHDRCGGCGACAVACPLDSAKHIVEGKWFGADCCSCARCLRVCPDQAIEYRSVWAGAKINDDSNAEAKDDESQPVIAD
jgi:polyferredoxin